MSTDFTVEIAQNEYLAEGGEDVNAVVTVTSPDSGLAAPVDDRGSAEIIIIDCSGSMRSPRTKIEQARAATAAAVDVIRDGVAFAVIAGTDTAQPIFPLDYGLAVADDQSRFLAKQAVAGALPRGGTAIGQWLRLAHSMFLSHPAALRHAILLTDGRNEHETPEELGEAIGLCEGVFSCDCRGVGTDWEVGELRRISSALLGTVDIVPDPSGLAADFAAMMETAMGKQVADVSLRVWTPQHATFRFLKQVAPVVEDLTGRRAQSGPQAGDYPTGAWGPGESRDYHLCVRVTPAGVGQEMLAARACSILVRGDRIDPEQSMMMISALPWSSAGAATPVSGEVTVTMALTSSAPSARYSFCEISTVKSVLIRRLLLGCRCRGRIGGHDHRDVVHAAGLYREADQRRGGTQRVGQRPGQRQFGQFRGAGPVVP